MNSSSDQRKDNVTATETTDRCAGASSLPGPVMAAPAVWEKSHQTRTKLREIQRGMTDMSYRVGD